MHYVVEIDALISGLGAESASCSSNLKLK